jgi:hypothetical protein
MNIGMTSNKDHILDDAAVPKLSIGWSIFAVLVGAAGAPLSIEMGMLTESFIPMLLISAASLSYIYLAQEYFIIDQRSGKRSRIAILGMVLTFIWAPLFFIWSLIFTFTHV